MSYPGYKMVTLFRFWAGGELWSTEDWGTHYIRIEEVRKNGQEDTHMYGEFIKVGDKWDVLMDGDCACENIAEYSSALQAVIDFLNQYGTPEI